MVGYTICESVAAVAALNELCFSIGIPPLRYMPFLNCQSTDYKVCDVDRGVSDRVGIFPESQQYQLLGPLCDS